MSNENKKIALAQYLECSCEEIEESPYDENLFEYGDEEYFVLTDEEADQLVRERIEQDVWAFNASFIIAHSKLPLVAEEMILSYQQDKCEDANETILALIEDFDEFVDDAVSSDGRGHFLSSYDGEENEVEVDGEYYFIYRQNWKDEQNGIKTLSFLWK